ncbi:MAG: hypothetical protein K6F58_05575, partial [Bacteroidales bacterium]|nr:hypothetical protein [Bacteroidales bacterium]
PPAPGGPAAPTAPGPQETPVKDVPETAPLPSPSDSLAAPADSITFASPLDTLAASPDASTEQIAAATDTLAATGTLAATDIPLAPFDTLAAPADTLRAPADTVLAPLDSTKIGFLDAKGNVRAFRRDIQIRCDSLRYNDLDSIARLYLDPIVWNDGNRQYTADSLFALVMGNSVDRVALESNAFVITQETYTLFDQIKATEIMAYFDSTAALRRFDGLGGTNAIFFIKEKERFGTVNKVETKMMSAEFKDGDLDRIYYFDSPKNDVYPLAQLKTVERELKGFSWRPELRPRGPRDITTLEVRPSQRAAYEKHPRTTFRQTDVYFPGYMKGVYKAIEDAKRRKEERGRTGPEPQGKDARILIDSLSLRDSLAAADTLAAADFLAGSDSLALLDSLEKADTLAVSDSVSQATEKVLTKAEIRARKKAEAERRRAERIAAREARWAVLDSLDAAKAAEKLAKQQAREKARIARQLERQRRQDLKDEAKLQKYIERYRKRKAREDARAEAKAAKAAAKAERAAARAAAKAPANAPADTLAPAPVEADSLGFPAPPEIPDSAAIQKDIKTIQPILKNGTDNGTLPPLRSGGHPKQRGVGEPALDPKTAESPETAL